MNTAPVIRPRADEHTCHVSWMKVNIYHLTDNNSKKSADWNSNNIDKHDYFFTANVLFLPHFDVIWDEPQTMSVVQGKLFSVG